MSVETLEPIDLDLTDVPIDIFELANAGATIESIVDQDFMPAGEVGSATALPETAAPRAPIAPDTSA